MAINRFDDGLVLRVQQANDIVDVISEHLSLTRKGKEMVGLCPFHDDNRPSLNISTAKQIFKCFACGAGGDVIKFIQMRENLTFRQALERLAARAGIKITPLKRTAGSADQQDPARLAKMNESAAKLWQKNLSGNDSGKAGRDYIAQRQINDESVKEWLLGFAVDSWDNLAATAKAKGLAESSLEQAGLAVKREDGSCYDKFRNRLMFPIVDVSGRVIGFGGRTLGDDPAKYMNSPATVLFDKSYSLYGLDRARHEIVQSGTVVVVEGYTDVIMAHQFGCKNVVATLGTSLTAGHAKILRRYAKRIVLIFDSDVAGIAAAARAMEICLAERIDIKIASVPPGMDPCDLLLAEGADAFKQIIENGVDVMEFQWNRLVERFEREDNLTDRRTASEEFMRSVATAAAAGNLDAISKGLIINRLARIVGVSAENINAELKRLRPRQANRASYAVQNQKVVNINLGSGFGAEAQKEIIEVLLNEPRLFDMARRKTTADSFDVPILKQIWEFIAEILTEAETFSMANLLSRIESVELAQVLTDMADRGSEKGNFKARLKGALEGLDEYWQNVKKNQNAIPDDEVERLRSLIRTKAGPDRRNPGMLST